MSKSGNTIILFSGLTNTGGKFLEAINDMWVWNGTNWQQQLPANLPSARFGACLAYDSLRHYMLLFGGGVGGGLLNDTWLWNGTTWIKQQPAHQPPARANFGMTYDEGRQQIILFGGQASVSILPIDTWVWNGNDWVQLQTIQDPPVQLSYAANLIYLSSQQILMLFNNYRQKTINPIGNDEFVEMSEVWDLEYVTI